MPSDETDVVRFFEKQPATFPLYQLFAQELLARFPETNIRVQKTQITFFCRHVYACVSFLRVKKKSALPGPYFVVTLGLPYPLACERVAAQTQPYPGRWTVHFVVSSPKDLDEEFFEFVEQAYIFSQTR